MSAVVEALVRVVGARPAVAPASASVPLEPGAFAAALDARLRAEGAPSAVAVPAAGHRAVSRPGGRAAHEGTPARRRTAVRRKHLARRAPTAAVAPLSPGVAPAAGASSGAAGGTGAVRASAAGGTGAVRASAVGGGAGERAVPMGGPRSAAAGAEVEAPAALPSAASVWGAPREGAARGAVRSLPPEAAVAAQGVAAWRAEGGGLGHGVSLSGSMTAQSGVEAPPLPHNLAGVARRSPAPSRPAPAPNVPELAPGATSVARVRVFRAASAPAPQGRPAVAADRRTRPARIDPLRGTGTAVRGAAAASDAGALPAPTAMTPGRGAGATLPPPTETMPAVPAPASRVTVSVDGAVAGEAVRTTLTARGSQVTARLEAGGVVAQSLAGSLHELVGALAAHGLEARASVARNDAPTAGGEGGGGQGAYPGSGQGGDGTGRREGSGADGRAAVDSPAFSLDARA